MAYPKEIQEMVNLIPKEHHKNIQKIIKFYHALGVQETQNLIKGVIEIPPEKLMNMEYIMKATLKVDKHISK